MYPGRKTDKVILNEGFEFDFKVLNIAVLQDSREYYILEDPNGTRHFIDAEMYANYGITPGTSITCKVVKINCTGRILLEPGHPIYSEGKVYFFNILSTVKIDGKFKVNVEDIFHNKIDIIIENDFYDKREPSISLKCRINEIRKGIPKLEYVSEEP